MTITRDESRAEWPEATARPCPSRLEAARLDGALLMARTIAHEINNALSPLVGYGELLVERLRSRGDSLDADQALAMLLAAEDAAQKVQRLQRVVRLQEASGAPAADMTVLDLARSTDRPEDAAAHPPTSAHSAYPSRPVCLEHAADTTDSADPVAEAVPAV